VPPNLIGEDAPCFALYMAWLRYPIHSTNDPKPSDTRTSVALHYRRVVSPQPAREYTHHMLLLC